MKPSLSSALLLAAALVAPHFAVAQEGEVRLKGSSPTPQNRFSQGGGTASEGADFLLLPTGARAAGMGGAVTALRGLGESVLWSPAGLASLDRKRLLFNHNETAFDTRSEVLAVLWPTNSLGTVGVTYYLVDFGELAHTDEQGTVQGNISFRNQEFLLSYAKQVIGSLEVGASYKLIQMVFRCDGLCSGQRSFTRTTHAVDLGAIYDQPVGLPIAIGASIRHLGFSLKGRSEDDPLPTRVRVGVSYEALSNLVRDSAYALSLAVDVEDQWRDLGGAPDVMIGSEFGVAERFFLRAGYAFQEQGVGGAALGLGLIYDWFYLDLSRGFDDISAAAGDESLQVTFGVLF